MGWTTALALVVALLSLAAAQFPVPPGAPSTLTVQFIIRDFVGKNPGPSPANRTTHQDFESTIATEFGIVQTTLGADRKPRLNSSVVTTTWTNATLFNQAWNDVPGVNLRLTRNFQMPWNTATGLYEYNNGNFFPINNDGYGNFGSTGKNFHFCLEYHTQFQFRGTETFAFTGDDDVYFFVNNRLFVDLGGVHGALDASRSLSSASVQQQFGLVVGGVYNFDFFFCERHTSASNLKMATNILLNDCLYLDRCGFCTATPPSGPLINPCNTLQCGNGTCSCQNATCVCQPGWVNGPLGNCSQRCGDGIIQGSEQCDPPGPCCTSSCLFAPANTVCPSAGRACVNYVCTGNSTTCGVPRPIGSPCNGTTQALQCQEFQCTAADGSTCALVPNPALTCSDNNACTTDVCTSLGTCVSTSQPCQPSVCRLAGTCNATNGQCSLGTPRADGTGCGPDPGLSICVQPTCVAGTCTNTSKPVNTPCGGASADGCSTQVCNGNGQCTSVPIVNAQSTKASCAQPAPGSCLQSLCSGTGCANFPIADGSACTNASLTGLTSCQRLGCSAGSCVILPTNEGATCTDGGALDNFGDDACNVKVCQSGQCVRKANTAIDGNTCNIDSSGVNPETGCRTYTCSAGNCTRANTKEGLACVNAAIPTDACTQLQCVSGTCTKTPANVNGVCLASVESGCTFYRCNSTGSCVAQTAVVDLPCGSTANQCSLSFCTAAGTCVAKPVTCNTAICNGLLACNTSTGVCELPSSVTVAACCGNGQVDAAGEECDNPNDPCCIDCKFAPPNTPCSDNECNPKVCTGLAGTQTVCTDNLQNGIACTSAAAPTNQCKELRCGGGTCAEVDKADNTACTLTNVPFCGQAVCLSGACQIVADAAKTGGDCTAAYGGVGGVPQCNKAVCSGTECVLADDNEGGACTALPAVECRDRKCSTGSCVYTFDAFPISPRTVCSGASSSSKCLLPGCDGAGTCILLNATAGTDCDLANNPECNVPKCNGGGVCTLVAINVGSPCTTSRDQQCQTSSCDVNGNCVVANVTDGAPCTRTDVGQCQDSVCQGGACVLQSTTAPSRVCTPTPDPAQDRSCFNYFCQADGTCETPSNKPDGTACTDANLCDTDTCQAGVCIHAPSVVCNTPTLPCENPDGTCLSAFGNCTYTGRGQYAACTPRASELDPRCNASVVGAYRCSTGAPDSACVPSCFSGGVCGDGIVQAGEDCDWGDPRTGGPCCNVTTCLWFQELAPCNNTDPEVVARVNAQIANLSDSSGLPELCFVQRCVFQSGLSVCTLGLDATVSDKCSGTSRSSNNRTAILASVIPGALLALCLAGLGFFLWRRAQKAAEQEWLQEYLNAGNVRVENNAAFVETQNDVNNAAFQPDGR